MTLERMILRVAFNVFVPRLLALDLLVFHRKTLAVSLSEVKGIVFWSLELQQILIRWCGNDDLSH
ncbi:MAG: hypothetical protein HYV01_26390 [Deltaproteobacteria bacterium]|nr:hypothetical protein [Deltaproteobacteria bacterium]